MTVSSKSNAIVLGLLFSLATVYAQDSLKVSSPQEKADLLAYRMKDELSLSGNQTQNVRAILGERFETLSKVDSDRVTQLKDANTIAMRKLADVLTPQQLSRYNEIRSETRKQKDEFLKSNPGYKFTDGDRVMDF